MECCADCKLEKENPAKYRLVIQYRHHGGYEEFHDRMARTNKAMNDGTSGYHRDMQYWHKNERLKVEAELAALAQR